VLVLTRRPDDSIMIGDDVEVTVIEVRGDTIRLGIHAPRGVPVHRKEIYEAIQLGNREASGDEPAAAPEVPAQR